jgi:hypothetical protein
MQRESEANHEESAAHLATCVACQAQLAALRKRPEAATGTPVRRTWPVVICAVLVLVMGYALGWWAWQLTHR